MGRVEYIVCPTCGRNRVIESKDKGRVGWPSDVNLETTILLQVREGGGKKAGEGGRGFRGSAPGSGFHLVPSESLTLPEMIESGEYDDALEGMKQQLLRVVRQSIDLGFIERNEI